MAILVTNDDGIYSKGLHDLAEGLSGLFDVIIVAPDREQSAVGHAITLSDPLRITEVSSPDGIPRYSCNGTPADAVKLGIKVVMDELPELVISGVNNGANVGASLIYSGTVSAATEATLLGIPSIAVSFDNRMGGNFSTAVSFTVQLTKLVLKHGLPDGVLLNVNIPDLPANEIKGVKVAVQGKTNFNDFFEKRKDPRGQIYYWMSGTMIAKDSNPDHDVAALHAGYITVTPVHYDLTAREFIRELENWGITKSWKNNAS